MRILNRYKGYQLLERYGKPYVRFWGGRDDDMPCEFPVSGSEAVKATSDAAYIKVLLLQTKSKIEWSAESFYRLGVLEYLRYGIKMSAKTAENVYEKLNQHPDIRNEFYHYIMVGTFVSNPLRVYGFTAEDLAAKYHFSPFGAYNYLIYLREMPEPALAALEESLPSRDLKTSQEKGKCQHASAHKTGQPVP